MAWMVLPSVPDLAAALAFSVSKIAFNMNRMAPSLKNGWNRIGTKGLPVVLTPTALGVCLPGVVDHVADGFFAIRRHLDTELNRLAVSFFERAGVLGDLPVGPAKQVLHHTELHWFLFVVAQLDLKALIDPMGVGVNAVRDPAAFSYSVKSVAGIEPDGLVGGRVVDLVLAGELELPVIVPAVEAHSPLGQRHAQIVYFAVLELLHHPDFGVGLDSVTLQVADIFHVVVSIVGVNLHAVVDINPLRLDAGGAYEFHLLGFAVMKRGGSLQGVEMVFVKGALGHCRPGLE